MVAETQSVHDGYLPIESNYSERNPLFPCFRLIMNAISEGVLVLHLPQPPASFAAFRLKKQNGCAN